MVEEIVATNFVLILVAIFLLIIILFLIVATRRQIRNMSVGISVATPAPGIDPKLLYSDGTTTKEPIVQPAGIEVSEGGYQPKVVEKIEEVDKAVEKVQPEVVKKVEEEQSEIFKCKKCGKELQDKKKLQRHIGMSHYQDLET